MLTCELLLHPIDILVVTHLSPNLDPYHPITDDLGVSIGTHFEPGHTGSLWTKVADG